MEEDTLYVALGENVKENRSILLWALHNSGGKKICIIHVHQRAQMIPFMGTRWPASSLHEQEVSAYREIQLQNTQNILTEYLSICRQAGARADTLHTEMDCIEKGIVKLIYEVGIRELVMGAAADKHYAKQLDQRQDMPLGEGNRIPVLHFPKGKRCRRAKGSVANNFIVVVCDKKMLSMLLLRKPMDLKSKKAIYVCLQAPISCSIKFVCKGHLIHTREPSLNGDTGEVRSSLPQASQNTKVGPSMDLQLLSVGQYNGIIPINPDQESFNSGFFRGSCREDISSVNRIEDYSTPRSRLDVQGSSDEWGRFSRRYTPGSVYSTCPPYQEVGIDTIPSLRIEQVENGLESSSAPESKENQRQSSPLSVLEWKIVDDTLYAKLQKSMAEAEDARHEALQEATRHGKAEKDAIKAAQRAKVLQRLYAEESKERREIEKALGEVKEKIERMKKQKDEVREELCIFQDKKSLLETQIAESDKIVKGLELRITSAMELLQNYKNERDEVQIERDNALKVAQQMRRKKGEVSSMYMPQFFSDFSYTEIKEATQNFDPSLKTGEGRYGSIYKGLLRHTQVAIKMLHHHGLQAPLGLQREIDILSKLRHPNLVTLIGSGQEACALIYEYLPKGSLEDRLRCKDNTPPLSWQTRISIAAELCSVLIFLHSSKPIGIVHGDLTPANVLLDANFCSKLCDFGICHLVPYDQSSKNTRLGTFAYMDPEFLSAGELTLKSDVYSFGIILLQLLTGRPALRITKDVKYALDASKLKELLDPLAGDWPFEHAEQLACLALRCCAPLQKSRPDLASEVWKVLVPMRASCGGSSSIRLGSEEPRGPPPYLFCPLSREIMRDPHVAADGYTYEAEALRKWLESGHDTSPTTKLKLEHHRLVPNHSLRSAIQQWRDKH